MQQKNEEKNSIETCTNGQPKGKWSNDDKKRLVTEVVPMIEMQKAYGRVLNMRLILQGWEAVLAEKYTVDQLIRAMKQYTLTGGDDFPSPKNLNDILDPPITYAQYKAAEIAQEKNGYPRFSYEATVIQQYHTQQSQQTDESGKLLPQTEKPMVADKRESKDDKYTQEKMQRVGNYVQQALDAIAENERRAMARKSTAE